MAEDTRTAEEPPQFTLTVTYPAANETEAEWLAGYAVQTLRCDPADTAFTVVAT